MDDVNEDCKTLKKQNKYRRPNYSVDVSGGSPELVNKFANDGSFLATFLAMTEKKHSYEKLSKNI